MTHHIPTLDDAASFIFYVRKNVDAENESTLHFEIAMSHTEMRDLILALWSRLDSRCRDEVMGDMVMAEMTDSVRDVSQIASFLNDGKEITTGGDHEPNC